MRRIVWPLLAAMVVVSAIAERFADHAHHLWFHDIPGFFTLFGFAGCVGIVLVAKRFGRLVQRGEDYYERDDEEAAP